MNMEKFKKVTPHNCEQLYPPKGGGGILKENLLKNIS